jgi:thiol:disulfide interchange protein DsbD
MLGYLLVLAAGLPVWAASSSADGPHVHVQLVVPTGGLYRGEPADAGLYFKLEPGWHIYWKNPGDAGEPPHIKWTLPEGITAGPMKFPAPKRLPLGPLMDYGYEDEVLFPFWIEAAKTVANGPVVLHAKVDWLVCQSSCVPGKAELEVSRGITPNNLEPVYLISDRSLFKRMGAHIPGSMPTGSRVGFIPTSDSFRLTVETGKRETEAAFFPADQDIIDNPAPQKVTPTAKGLILDLKKDKELKAAPAQLRGVLELSGGRAYEIVALPGTAAAAGAKTTGTSGGGGEGELSPKDASGGKSAENEASGAKAQASSDPGTYGLKPVPFTGSSPADAARFSMAALLRASGLAFLGGLLLNLMPCVFPVLFLKGLALVQSGNEERKRLRAHGFVYAAGIVASFWVLVGALLAVRAAGSSVGWGFQFQSPVVLELMAGLLFFLGLSLAGQFEIGLTLTSAGGSLAAKQGYAGSFFTGVLAVVVATPCTAPLMGAAIGYALAAPAAVTFAVFTCLALGLAAPYVALTLQPAWARVLPRPGVWMEVLRQAVSVPIFATVIWLAWVLARAYGADLLAALLAGFVLLAVAGWFLGRWPAKRWASIVAGAILAGVVALGVFAPQRLVGTTAAEADAGWQVWSAADVARYQAEGRPVFVDFTASWCLSCQVNERVALGQPEVEEAFKAKHVVRMRADWTRRDEAITATLTGLGRSGVPTYVLYAPGDKSPRLLPEVLTPGIVLDALGGVGK